MKLQDLEKYFKNKKNIILIGKGSSIDKINFENVSFKKKENLIININDSETIYEGSFSIISNNLVKKRFETKILKPSLSFYISDTKISNCNTLILNKNLLHLNEPGLIVTKLLSDDLCFYNQAILTAIHLASYFARKFNNIFETYLLGFDLGNYKNISESSLDNSIFESNEYSNQNLYSQFQYLKILIPLGKNLKLNLKHIGDSSLSILSSNAFQRLFYKKNNLKRNLNKNIILKIQKQKDYRKKYKVKIVAEITTNHFGDKERLFAMVKAAAQAGADYIKLQRRDVDTFYSQYELNLPYKSPFGDSFRDYRLSLELSDEDFKEIDKLCKKLGIGWFASILDLRSFQSFRKFNPKIIKLPSTISDHKNYLKYVSKSFKGIIVLSTGYTNSRYEKFILDLFKNNKKIYLLHCTSAYPAPEAETNISIIRRYNNLSLIQKNIIPGYSSHDLGSLCSQLAVSCGAKMIEKHVKFGDVSWAHFDSVALDLANDEFKNFVDDIRRTENIMGSDKKKIQPSENHKYWLKKKYINN